jgi:hypothetical protein
MPSPTPLIEALRAIPDSSPVLNHAALLAFASPSLGASPQLHGQSQRPDDIAGRFFPTCICGQEGPGFSRRDDAEAWKCFWKVAEDLSRSARQEKQAAVGQATEWSPRR